jgi:hypothetical protein
VAPAEPAKPKARRQNCRRAGRHARALAHEIERDLAHLAVLVLVEHLEAVDDGADRADQVVADAAGDERREVEGGGRFGHRADGGFLGAFLRSGGLAGESAARRVPRRGLHPAPWFDNPAGHRPVFRRRTMPTNGGEFHAYP